MIDKNELLNHWYDAISSGTFLTYKHDPSSIGTSFPGYRTVTVKSQPEIDEYLKSGEYKLRLYQNTKYPNSPDYVEIVPNDPAFVTGSGIIPNSPSPTTTDDRFIVTSGTMQGYHIRTENSSNIQKSVGDGSLIFISDLD